mgnify:CR=1 FL=1
MNFEELPEEMKQEVMLNMSPSQLAKFCITNRKYKVICESEQFFIAKAKHDKIDPSLLEYLQTGLQGYNVLYRFWPKDLNVKDALVELSNKEKVDFFCNLYYSEEEQLLSFLVTYNMNILKIKANQDKNEDEENIKMEEIVDFVENVLSLLALCIYKNNVGENLENVINFFNELYELPVFTNVFDTSQIVRYDESLGEFVPQEDEEEIKKDLAPLYSNNFGDAKTNYGSLLFTPTFTEAVKNKDMEIIYHFIKYDIDPTYGGHVVSPIEQSINDKSYLILKLLIDYTYNNVIDSHIKLDRIFQNVDDEEARGIFELRRYFLDILW